jgi:Tol biopolymer transport system component
MTARSHVTLVAPLAAAVLYAIACFLPGEPRGAGRVTFVLDFSQPYRVPLAGAVQPSVKITVDGQALSAPNYHLESLDPGVVQVDATGRGLEGVARGAASVRVVYETATGAPDTVFAVQVVVARVAVDRPTLTFTRLGDTTRLKATAFDASGTAVPNVAFTWSSSDSLLAQVDATGLVTALDEGTVAIAAAADSVKGVASVAVTQVAAGVEVAPRVDTLHTVGRTVQFSAIAFDSTSSILPFAKAHWTSSDPAVARVDTAGLVTVTGAGTAKIIARVGTAADTASLVVRQVVRFLIVTPGLDTLTAIADTSRIVAVARDSLHFPIPNPVVTWATGDPKIATVDPTGRVTAAANGVVLVTASSEGQSAFATVLVRQEAVAARLSQDSVALTGKGDTVRLSAVGLDRNGYLVAGAAFGWRSGSGCVATVDAAGLITARGEGSTAIIASPANGGQSDTTVVSVAGAPSQCQHSIAFQSSRDGDYEIYLMNADGSGQVNLTDNPGYDYAPVWSPDGTRIAFTSNRDGNNEIYVMNADGSGLLNLTNNPGYDYAPAWSPDGTRIAFTSNRDGNSEIYVVNTDGSGLHNLTNNPAEDGGVDFVTRVGLSWSPNGAKIAFVSARDGTGEIYVMNADGSGVTRLTSTYAITPVWSPDGARIAFVNSAGISVMNADGSGVTSLHQSGHLDGWSPDGSKIAFQSGIFCIRGCSVRSYIVVMNADGTGVTQLTNTGGDFSPVWSPDGTRIAFASNRDGNSEIYVVNTDGSGLHNLTNNPGGDYTPAWRPR